jgi:hypothetical protein
VAPRNSLTLPFPGTNKLYSWVGGWTEKVNTSHTEGPNRVINAVALSRPPLPMVGLTSGLGTSPWYTNMFVNYRPSVPCRQLTERCFCHSTVGAARLFPSKPRLRFEYDRNTVRARVGTDTMWDSYPLNPSPGTGERQRISLSNSRENLLLYLRCCLCCSLTLLGSACSSCLLSK